MPDLNPILGTFRSPELEQSFRASVADEELQRFSAVAIAVAAIFLVFIVTDYRLHGPSIPFYILLGVRAVALCACVGMALLARRIRHGLDRLVLAWGFVALTCGMFINWSRPPDYFGHVAVDVLSVAMIFVFLPGPLSLQATLGSSLAVSQTVLLWLAKTPPDPYTLTAATSAMIAAIVLGALASRRLHVSKREQFAALAAESEARHGLEKALGEIETLRGLVPICSSCKSIRDDHGEWQQMERYIQEHSLAEFSHGVCPSCATDLYPDDI